MALTAIEQTAGQTTIVNTDQITYIREDSYGTSIHFSSGEHVVCALDLSVLLERLGTKAGEFILARSH